MFATVAVIAFVQATREWSRRSSARSRVPAGAAHSQSLDPLRHFFYALDPTPKVESQLERQAVQRSAPQ